MSKHPPRTKTEKRLDTLAAQTLKQKEALLSQFLKYPIVQVACERASVGRATYYSWRETDTEFAKRADTALHQGKKFISDLAESRLISLIQQDHVTPIIFWLKNHHPDYSERVRHEHTIEVPELNKEQQEAISKALIHMGFANTIKLNQQEADEVVDEYRKDSGVVVQKGNLPKIPLPKPPSKGVDLKKFFAKRQAEARRKKD